MGDLFGFVAPSKFKDIRSTRPSVAQRKAELLLELGRLCNRFPNKARDGDIKAVREWKLTREAAMKIAANSRASVEDLTRAIGSMAPYRDDA